MAIERFEQLIRRDPARRGLIAREESLPPLCRGHLRQAAEHLAAHGRAVAIVTGFFVPSADVPAAETDGPLGALVLADVLQRLGIPAVLITDRPCAAAVQVLADAVGPTAPELHVCPLDAGEWVERFCQNDAATSWSHLIAVERVGPSHTETSILEQDQAGQSRAALLDRFRRLVPPESQDRCHNMRGQVIDDHTARLHRLFEQLPQRHPEVKTIGIGDGGNEIGMGCIPWSELVRRLDGPLAARIPCRVETDWNVVAGISNWGAYALAAAVAVLRGEPSVLKAWPSERQFELLQRMVEEGPGVDGATGRREPTVDGLPFVTCIQAWEGLCEAAGVLC